MRTAKRLKKLRISATVCLATAGLFSAGYSCAGSLSDAQSEASIMSGQSEDSDAAIRSEAQTEKPATYPEALCRAGIGGDVPLRVAVDSVGRPYAIEVENSSGHRDLDIAAVEAAKGWRYAPAVVGGKKKRGGWARFAVKFDPQSEQCQRIVEKR